MSAVPRASQILLVGQKIRQIRKSRHLTQADLAARIGVTQSDLSRMENGEYKVGLDTLFRILQVFELSMSHFFEEPRRAGRRRGGLGGRHAAPFEDWAALPDDTAPRGPRVHRVQEDAGREGEARRGPRGRHEWLSRRPAPPPRPRAALRSPASRRASSRPRSRSTTRRSRARARRTTPPSSTGCTSAAPPPRPSRARPTKSSSSSSASSCARATRRRPSAPRTTSAAIYRLRRERRRSSSTRTSRGATPRARRRSGSSARA